MIHIGNNKFIKFSSCINNLTFNTFDDFKIEFTTIKKYVSSLYKNYENSDLNKIPGTTPVNNKIIELDELGEKTISICNKDFCKLKNINDKGIEDRLQKFLITENIIQFFYTDKKISNSDKIDDFDCLSVPDSENKVDVFYFFDTLKKINDIKSLKNKLDILNYNFMIVGNTSHIDNNKLFFKNELSKYPNFKNFIEKNALSIKSDDDFWETEYYTTHSGEKISYSDITYLTDDKLDNIT